MFAEQKLFALFHRIFSGIIAPLPMENKLYAGSFLCIVMKPWILSAHHEGLLRSPMK
jgi:hypothetical protein